MTRRGTSTVYLHIGAPKTGTTYLQDRLSLNAKALARHGLVLPAQAMVSPTLFHFRAALDLLGQDWGGSPGHADGSWDALVRRVRRSSGTVIVSHEIFSAARPDKVQRLKRDLEGAELHVVYTVRDLARQIPAAWQESVKQGRTWRYGGFLRRVQRDRSWFSRAFDLPTVLTNWGAGLAPERIHVVTVPQPGAPRDTLWKRFCEVIEIDPAWAPLESNRTNPSLGAAETQVLRRLNKRLGRAVRADVNYDDLVRVLLAEERLAGRESTSVTLPPALLPWAAERAEHWIEWIEASGVHVVGDLAELLPQPSVHDEEWSDADSVPPRRQLDAALEALAAMTQEAARRADPDRQLGAKVRAGARRLRGQ